MARMNFKRVQSQATVRQLVTQLTQKPAAQTTASKVIQIRAWDAWNGCGEQQSQIACEEWLAITEAVRFGKTFK